MSDIDRGYETESSNFTNYIGVVVDSRFQINEHNGDPELVLRMRTDSPKLPEYTERYRLGSTVNNAIWVPIDNGARVQASDGSTKFRDNSNYGKFIKAAVEAAKISPQTGRSPDGRQWDGTREAASWQGTKWQMKETKGTFTNRDTGEKVEWTKNFPAMYLGWEEVPPAAPGTTASTSPGVGNSSGASATGSLSQARPVTDFAEALQELDARSLGRMITLAKEYSHSKWVDEVMEQLPMVLTNTMLMKEISRADGLYLSLRSHVG